MKYTCAISAGNLPSFRAWTLSLALKLKRVLIGRDQQKDAHPFLRGNQKCLQFSRFHIHKPFPQEKRKKNRGKEQAGKALHRLTSESMIKLVWVRRAAIFYTQQKLFLNNLHRKLEWLVHLISNPSYSGTWATFSFLPDPEPHLISEFDILTFLILAF